MPRLLHRVRHSLASSWPSVVEVALAEAEDWSADEADRYCVRCGASSGPYANTETGCPFCRDRRMPWRSVTRLSGYVEPMDGWIKAMKFGRQWAWGRWFGERLATSFQAADQLAASDDNVLICPVPMHWMRRWSRGFNQAELIAKSMAEAGGWRFAPLLSRVRYTYPQTAVAASQRPANIRGSVAMPRIDLSGKTIILVDDVKTTGSTARLCCQLLRQAKVDAVHLAVAAVADPHHQDFQSIKPG